MSGETLQEAAVQCRAEKYQSPYASLMDELYREEVLEARAMKPEDKLILGEPLFRWACAVTLEGIRLQNPTATEADRQRILRERLDLGRKLEALQ
jgi:hypothetical protein